MDSNMIKQVRNVAGSALLGATVLFTPAASALAMPGTPTDTLYQQQNQTGLVNLAIGDVNVQVPLGVALNVAAQLCDTQVGVLAQQVQGGGAHCDIGQDATAVPVAISRQ
jgi:hypothetical protein